jgi:hypothetical protein
METATAFVVSVGSALGEYLQETSAFDYPASIVPS